MDRYGSNGTAFAMAFDAEGVVTQIQTTLEDGSVVTVTVTNSTSTVDGSDVMIEVVGDTQSASFTGILSANENRIDGEGSRTISITDNVTITLPAAEFDLLRVGADACEGVDCDEGEEYVDGVCAAVDPCEDITCDEGRECVDGECVAIEPGPADTFPTSLHDANFRGMETFYAAANGGIELLTGIPYGDDRLDCHVCHDKSRFENADPPVEWPGKESCANCHVDPADPSQPVTEQICLGCHSRQGAERNHFTDVHRDAGFVCMDCHASTEMHGDGNVYDSLLESPSVACEDCHAEGGSAPVAPASVAEHATHLANIDCSTCHMQSVISCYSCHFDTQLAGAGKRAFAQRTGFIFLVNRDDKVHGATFRSVIYEQNTFNVIAPYYAHSITAEGRICSDCHAKLGGDIPAITEYNATGTVTLTTWDDAAEGAARLTGPTGVIPVPMDWPEAFQFAWVDYSGPAETPIAETDPALWVNIESTPAGTTQMLFGTPLTDAQMASLGATGP